MRRLMFSLGLLLCSLTTASAQLPQQPFAGQPNAGGLPGQYGPFDQYGFGQFYNPSPQMPNIYNPQTQPLSPYLYTVRGTNPAVDYFFGTRPGTLGMGGRTFGGAPFVAAGGNRMIFFPQLANAPDPFGGNGGITSQGSVLPPAGHMAVFQNTLGYFPSPFGQAGGNRPGLAGLGGGQKK
jgi:hypothetical protein